MSYEHRYGGDRSDSLFCTPPPDDLAPSSALAEHCQRNDGCVGMQSIGEERADSFSSQNASLDTNGWAADRNELQHTHPHSAFAKVNNLLLGRKQQNTVT